MWHLCLSILRQKKKTCPHIPFLNPLIRLHYRSMQPCWRWTPSRSNTVDFPTLGNQNISLLFYSLCSVCCSTFCTQTVSNNIICPVLWFSARDVLTCVVLSYELFYFDTIRCLQDAEVLLKLTEEVNATFRNKVSFFFSFCFLFMLLFF